MLSEKAEESRFLNFQINAISYNLAYYFYSKVTVDSSFYSPITKLLNIQADATTDAFYYEMPLQLIEITSNSGDFLSYQTRAHKQRINTFNNITGTIFKLSDVKINIEEVTADFFSGIENVWTFTVICFTVIVMKFTKYVNLKEKQRSRTAEKAEFRDSICIFLAKVNGLLHGRHRRELEEMKLYVKQPLPI